jgi:hypothetical protein
MRRLRAVRFVVPLVIVAVLVAAASSVLATRPGIDDAHNKVDASWNALAAELGQRYSLLANADERLGALPGPVAAIALEVDAAITRWQGRRGTAPVDEQVAAANTLEALGRRLVVTAAASPAVANDAAAKQALAEYLADQSFAQAGAFNAAVAAYEAERRGPVRRLVASVFGNGSIPAFAAPA